MALPATIALLTLCGCGAGSPSKEANKNFFTSGSRDADQRASQRMAQNEQLTASGECAGERNKKSAKNENAPGGDTNKMAKAEGKTSLYERLGGEVGISNIVADFTARVLDDPRVNWSRKGVTRGGLSIHANKSVAWDPNEQNVATLKQHLVEFFALATGGPPHYTGKDIQATHKDMKISNPEFDAAVGDLKASLDKLQIANTEQKELLAIVESTRPQIVTER